MRNIRGHWTVTPDNLALHAVYTFKYHVDTRPTGTVVYTTNEKTLVVGCTPDVNINLEGFSTNTIKEVGTAFDYEIGLPTIGRTYCNLTSIILVDVQ